MRSCKLMKVISIFGGTGYIGTHLTAALANAGYKVRIFSRDRNVQNSAECMDFVTYRQGCDFTDRDEMRAALTGSDIIINLIGIWDSKKSRLQRAHIDLPIMLYELADELGISKMIHMSALGASKEAKSRYLSTKYQAEEALVERSKESRVMLDIIRPSLVLGHEDPFSYFMARLINYLPWFPLPLANSEVQPIYLDDLVRFIIALLEADQEEAAIYEVAGPTKYTLKELVSKMALEIKGSARGVKSLPNFITAIGVTLFGWLPGSPLTRNQYQTAKVASVTNKNALMEFGIEPLPMESLFAYELHDKVRDQYFDDRLMARRSEEW